MIHSAQFISVGKEGILLMLTFDNDVPTALFQKLASHGIISDTPFWAAARTVERGPDGNYLRQIYLQFPNGEDGPLKKSEYHALRRTTISALREAGYTKKLNSIKLYGNEDVAADEITYSIPVDPIRSMRWDAVSFTAMPPPAPVRRRVR